MAKGQVFRRHEQNPVLTPGDLPFQVNAIMNPGVAEVDGEIILLPRIEDARGISGIHVARSRNGVDGWEIAPRPLLEPGLPDHPYERWGCEDPRVTKIGPNKWVIAYTAYSSHGSAVALAITEDFVTATRLGVILSPPNKDATIFPEQTPDGNWLLLHRPVTGAGEHIWYACSPDMQHWAKPGLLFPEGQGPWWDAERIGVGAPPIATPAGWLLIYHGVKLLGGHRIYRLGLALLDRRDPRQVLARTARWVFAPEASYEQHGLVPGVVYTCGALDRDGETWMYYGAADTVIGLAIARTADLVEFAQQHDFLTKPSYYLE
ncbi:MAG: glycosidase [Chloroflexi bacterium]|jgi:predicted GH43/DUF377 family glycosyl hydrolase|nr:glycosidase [Chloroflexota bacterium]